MCNYLLLKINNSILHRLLARSRNMLMTLEEETGVNPGWIQNGGLFIAHDKVSLFQIHNI